MVRSPTWSPLGLLLAFCLLVWLEELEAPGFGGAGGPLVRLPEGAGGSGLVGDAGGTGGGWMPGATRGTKRIRPTRKTPSQEMSTPLLEGGGNGCGQEVKRLALWCLPSTPKWMGRRALPLVFTALVLAEGLGAACSQAPGLAQCHGCSARLSYASLKIWLVTKHRLKSLSKQLQQYKVQTGCRHF